ncbi:MAG: methyltransferase domain-containing protein [Sulfurovum sp.]|nr:methyltransferase domain-containing protein [Sulfurovum sp.]
MDTVKFYDSNAKDFFESTYAVDMLDVYKKFETDINPHSRILDAGCGSGRDTKYFLDHGHDVVAIDASKEMVKLARELTKIDVKHMTFQEMKYVEDFDAIWSCASLLHIKKSEIPLVFSKFIQALKVHGVWYMSFKMGESEREKDGRLFNDYTIGTLKEIFKSYDELSVCDIWITEDRREDREDKWINAIVKKI